MTMPEPVIIKKYANRRLYDTEQRAFVSLGQIAHLIREGRDVQVRDEKTGEDVTAFVLTQIILEEARKKSLLLPVSLLSLLIRSGTTVLSEFFEKYLEQVLKNYLAYKQAMDAQFRAWLELGQDISSLTSQAMANLPPLPWLEMFAKPAAPPTEPEEREKA
jgi:polyhydroxyalkanoate synthesis repressor PhaR